MVINHIKNDGDAMVMGGLDEFFQGLGAAVVALDGENVSGIIAL
jgi:hypothetical protein